MASKPLSVAHISLARGYKGNERQTELLIKELAKLGVPQTLVCRDDSPLPIHVEGVNKLRIVKIAGLSDPSFIGHFKIGSSPTILHAHEAHAIKWCFLHYLFFGIPYIITARKHKPEKKGFFDSAYYNSAAAVVGISKIIKNNFEQAFKRKVEFIGDCSSNFRANPEIVQRYRQALKNRFVVGDTVGKRVNVVFGHGHKVAEKSVDVDAEHLHFAHAVLLVTHERTDNDTGAEFETAVTVVAGNVRHGGVSGHDHLIILFGIAVRGEIRKVGRRYCHFRHLQFDFAFLFGQNTFDEFNPIKVLDVPRFHNPPFAPREQPPREINAQL